MFLKFLKVYVDKLTINDINQFALKNDIILTEDEKVIIYKYIKKEWRLILSDDYNKVLDEAKPHLESKTYEKIKELIILYRYKYKNYL